MRNLHTFSHGSSTYLYFHQQFTGTSRFLHILTNTYFSFFDDSHSTQCGVV